MKKSLQSSVELHGFSQIPLFGLQRWPGGSSTQAPSFAQRTERVVVVELVEEEDVELPGTPVLVVTTLQAGQITEEPVWPTAKRRQRRESEAATRPLLSASQIQVAHSTSPTAARRMKKQSLVIGFSPSLTGCAHAWWLARAS